MQEEIYDGTEAAATAIGASRQTIHGWLKSGRLRGERIRRAGAPTWRIKHCDLVDACKGTMFEQLEIPPNGRIEGSPILNVHRLPSGDD